MGWGEQQLRGAKDRLRAPPGAAMTYSAGAALCNRTIGRTGRHQQGRAGEGKTLLVVGPCARNLRSPHHPQTSPRACAPTTKPPALAPQ